MKGALNSKLKQKLVKAVGNITLYGVKIKCPYMLVLADDAIDILRKNFNIQIYNTVEPFVSPVTNKIEYGFSVKVCNIKFGWNGRTYLGRTKWTSNIYDAKREAIDIALNWIISQKSDKSKKSKTVSKK